MAFLSEHAGVGEVVGVDGIRKALEEFVNEHPHLKITETNGYEAFERFEGDGISLLKGDFFALNDGVTNGKFDGIFDRGSIVAIDPSLRKKYVDILGKLIKPGGSILMTTVDRRDGTEEGKSAGPPFSVDGEEINRLYGNLDWVSSIQKLDEMNEFQDEESKKRWTMQGVDSLYELVYVVKAKVDF
jgi:thiopurine S-methyltransferase